MSGPDFDQMTKEQVIAWFKTTQDLSPMVASAQPATEPAGRPASDSPMMLVSIRLPVALVEQVDSIADLAHQRRSEVIRAALTAYVANQTAPVGPAEAERALEVLRRLVAGRADPPGRAA